MDIFAGAGGLGDGFEAFGRADGQHGAFSVALSAEMEPSAVRTLQTRAFFRSFSASDVPRSYYDYAAGRREKPWTESSERIWLQACERVCKLKLGERPDDRILDERIGEVARSANARNTPWVLVGGPPCQAFSVVGRARNKGIKNYIAKDDKRLFLYLHYLKILSRHQPSAFVLENVKGMLSSEVEGQRLFDEIFENLHRPGGARGPRYRIVPLVRQPGSNGSDATAREFILRAENLGLPQTRHRVILVGIREDVATAIPLLEQGCVAPTVEQMIGTLPAIRSGTTDVDIQSWDKFSALLLADCAKLAGEIDADTSRLLRRLAPIARAGGDPGTGSPWIPAQSLRKLPGPLDEFIRDPRLHGVMDHESRRHMKSDLMRYAYASAFAQIHDRSPTGAKEFPLALHPAHKSWGKPNRFVDRFKVQRAGTQASTVTSHLEKDGHYFIHYDPLQVRSLTVREAARLQTFPDNYIFEGCAGAKRRQVGNAVPPWLGHQVASVLHQALK